ncbi:mycofactocin-associated electron transfer flavoprotein alpha subunit [Rhabdothermincola salaria]|uniref:mycofactocin-associated electron transfer flavoprotein alpha subunit n=1 Tax=Rhabdothermincola salaria TaxID=2903142 RepID=UPI001E314FC8|nr:mycofactocin-associated electron transfer flavoprotein alpha subunit [Rhabdothermincola salaria]MCD9624405.1 mycofactocin-associated electron transfer flavoprotein alpha subunit [Rhabdothermincola salaria]
MSPNGRPTPSPGPAEEPAAQRVAASDPPAAKKRAAKKPAAKKTNATTASRRRSGAAKAGGPSMLAVVPVRDGHLPLGGDEAVAEAGGRALLVGDGTAQAAAALASARGTVQVCEQPDFAPGAWAAGLAATVTGADVVIVPASPDGRDLAPRLADVLGRPLLAGAVAVRPDGATVARRGGLVTEAHVVAGPFVATLQPGVRGVDRHHGPARKPRTRKVDLVPADAGSVPPDPELLELLPADPSTMDLAEAPRLLGAGAGLGKPEAIEVMAEVADSLGASTGGTRVVTDWGWMPVERQIGTTGVTVQPELYLAFGISGAVQHTAGLGQPEHVIAVNIDASCPMMAMADLAVVADAPAVLAALAERLSQITTVDAPTQGDDNELQPSLPAGAVPTGEDRSRG